MGRKLDPAQYQRLRDELTRLHQEMGDRLKRAREIEALLDADDEHRRRHLRAINGGSALVAISASAAWVWREAATRPAAIAAAAGVGMVSSVAATVMLLPTVTSPVTASPVEASAVAPPPMPPAQVLPAWVTTPASTVPRPAGRAQKPGSAPGDAADVAVTVPLPTGPAPDVPEPPEAPPGVATAAPRVPLPRPHPQYAVKGRVAARAPSDVRLPTPAVNSQTALPNR